MPYVWAVLTFAVIVWLIESVVGNGAAVFFVIGFAATALYAHVRRSLKAHDQRRR